MALVTVVISCKRNDAFGFYLGGGLPNPGNVNQALIDWFTNNLN